MEKEKLLVNHYIDAPLSRRSLIKAGVGFASALTLMGVSVSPVLGAIQFDSKDERLRRQKAEYVMTFGSPYDSRNADYSPHMHQEFKHNVQTLSKGRIFVDIGDQGRLGIGPELMVNVARGQVVAGLVSLSNLSPIAPELDILNIPFWAADNQSYLNLITSPIWHDLILKKIRDKGAIEVLFNYVIGPRTATTTKSYKGIIRKPADVEGMTFRIPSSKTLGVFYSLAGARPRKVSWGFTAEAARKAMFQALDPGIIGLYNGPDNLKDQIYNISLIDSVHDGWAAVINQHWLKQLPPELKDAIMEASALTFQQELKKVHIITQRCKEEFRHLGTRFYEPTLDEKAQWIEKCGYVRPEWTPVKKRILGYERLFDQLLEAAKTNNGHKIAG